MSSRNDWSQELLAIAKQLISWIIGKPSSKFVMLGMLLWAPGALDFLAMLAQTIQSLRGLAPLPTVPDDFGYSRALGVVLIMVGVGMTLFEWWQPHSTKANRLNVVKAKGQVQLQRALRTTFANFNDADLQLEFERAWGPVNADPQQIRNVLGTNRGNPGRAMDRFIRGMALVKADGNWFELRSRLTPAAFWLYFVMTIVSVVVGGLCLFIVCASLVFPELKIIPVETKVTLAILGGLIGYSVFAFKQLMLEFRSAVDLVKM
ncbi:hypothetical protein [Pseudomonas fitomaticsae]|uniref:Type II secretion system protein GspF domain-containing protein n=1 Tax=Pseudomonas fitomaticsae TaxID=2837969 RepID=A0ABY3PWE6_9PSED|nr:hypothetical protein [Pseudomonas fitomaticsae]UFP98243.1 hypothetical protein KJY40_19575 [Pseudomonas fitomaticsae]